MTIEIDFYFGLGSRYSYLAFSQIDRIEAAFDCRFVLYPLSSIELMALRGGSPFDGAAVSGQYEWSYRERDALAWADYYGIPYIEPAALPDDHRLMAKACVAAGCQGEMRAYSRAMFDAVFATGSPVDADVCSKVADRLGLDLTQFAADLASDHCDAAISKSAREAVDRGAFGVPTFFFGETFWWGNDRLVLLEQHLEDNVARRS